jgi:hypothetical protein
VGLTEAFRHLTNLTTLSLQNVPRVTNKSCIYIGKFINSLVNLDLSGTTQVRRCMVAFDLCEFMYRRKTKFLRHNTGEVLYGGVWCVYL